MDGLERDRVSRQRNLEKGSVNYVQAGCRAGRRMQNVGTPTECGR